MIRGRRRCVEAVRRRVAQRSAPRPRVGLAAVLHPKRPRAGRYTCAVSTWTEIATALFVYVFVGWLFVLAYLGYLWFLQATDVTLDYSWTREGDQYRPELELVNHSRSKTYWVTKIAYQSRADGLVWFDARSLMGKVIEPRSAYEFHRIAPVRNCSSIPDCLEMQIRVRLQTGKDVMAASDQPGATGLRALQKAALRLRTFLEG